MVFADEVFYIHGPPTHLLSVYVANQRLLADRIFLAHAASLRQTSFFQHGNSEGFFTASIHMDGFRVISEWTANNVYPSAHHSYSWKSSERKRSLLSELS
jgi:hypothetical protein